MLRWCFYTNHTSITSQRLAHRRRQHGGVHKTSRARARPLDLTNQRRPGESGLAFTETQMWKQTASLCSCANGVLTHRPDSMLSILWEECKFHSCRNKDCSRRRFTSLLSSVSAGSLHLSHKRSSFTLPGLFVVDVRVALLLVCFQVSYPGESPATHPTGVRFLPSVDSLVFPQVPGL